MEAISTLLDHKRDVLLIAPPAWGKTRLLIEMIKKSRQPWVFVSPLRALANEFFQVMAEQVEGCYLISRKEHLGEINKFRLLIVTPEVCSTSYLEQFEDLKIIYDEFHLIYYWGDTFRFSLSELYQWSANQNIPKLLLTATMSREHLERVQNELPGLIGIDLGNQKLKNQPRKIFGYTSKQLAMMKDNLMAEILTTDQTILIFCQYRQEVWDWLETFKKLNVKALGCVGGRSSEFQELLKHRPQTQVIVATSCLSHGVNLPPIHQIFLTYPLKNKDFWIQMVGRGGRKGENFVIHTMDFYEDYGRKIWMLFSTIGLWIRSKIKLEIL